ncbi:hypothetical protein IG631_16604 [Alternaria alternata]|nr:hypothetical protein IG631_16604 [Alternaria alternata]
MTTASGVYIHEMNLPESKAAGGKRPPNGVLRVRILEGRQCENATSSPPSPSTGGAVYARRKKKRRHGCCVSRGNTSTTSQS